jgi:[acyl-carrier-protein] S-malonyltransferase
MKIAFVFPGQGSQKVGMGKDLFEGFQEVKDLYVEANEALGYDVATLSFDGPEEELNHTMRTQPCLVAASMAAAKALELGGIRPEAVAGHSLGEYSALVSAGVLSFSDALKITEMRGKLMQEAVPEGKGLMAAVLGLERGKVAEICGSVKSGYVAPANFNCPGQIVISGEKEAVEEAMKLAEAAEARKVVPLAVSVPSHCKLMEETSNKLAEFLFVGEIEMKDPTIPVISNADAMFLTTVDGIKAALVSQLKGPVLWEDSIAAMEREGFDTFIEVGPGRVLSGLIKRISRDVKILNVEDRASLEKTIEALKG